MTQIEDLLREALASTPTTSTTVDPLGAIDRRVRVARRWIAAGGVAVAAAVVAAVVVPIAVLGGNANGKPSSVGIANAPSTVISVAAAPNGTVWVLVDKGNGDYAVGQNGSPDSDFTDVQGPAARVYADDMTVWVVGSTRVTGMDTATRTQTSGNVIDSGTFGDAAVVDGTLFVDRGDSVERLTVLNGSSVNTIGMASAGDIATTSDGHLWVQSKGSQLVELIPTPYGAKVGATVQWTGDIYTATQPRSAPDGIWAYDGSRLIALIPSALSGCVSCAEGDRVEVSGQPLAVVQLPGGGLYVANQHQIVYRAPADLGSGTAGVDADLNGITVNAMVADPAGGVDYIDGQGNLVHWDPTAAP